MGMKLRILSPSITKFSYARVAAGDKTLGLRERFQRLVMFEPPNI